MGIMLIALIAKSIILKPILEEVLIDKDWYFVIT